MEQINIKFQPKQDYKQIDINGYSKIFNNQELYYDEADNKNDVSAVFYQFGDKPTLFHKLDKSSHVWKLITNNPQHKITIYIISSDNKLDIKEINHTNPSSEIILPNNWIAGISSHPDCEILCIVSPQFNNSKFSLMSKDVFNDLELTQKDSKYNIRKDELYKFVKI